MRARTIRDPLGSVTVRSSSASRIFPQNRQVVICILFTHPTAILDSLLCPSEGTFVAAIARTIRIAPTGVVVGKIRRFADAAKPAWTFRYAPQARIRPDSENSRPPGRQEGRNGKETRR